LNKGSSDWGSLIGDQVLEVLLGDVFTVKLTNNLSNSLFMSSEFGSKINISIIIWETFIKEFTKGFTT